MKVGKHGVVRDPRVHIEVIEKVLAYAQSIGLSVLGLDFSPIKGPEGNIEYLAYLTKTETPDAGPVMTDRIVLAAHASLDRQDV